MTIVLYCWFVLRDLVGRKSFRFYKICVSTFTYGHELWKAFQAFPAGKRTGGRPRNHWRGYIASGRPRRNSKTLLGKGRPANRCSLSSDKETLHCNTSSTYQADFKQTDHSVYSCSCPCPQESIIMASGIKKCKMDGREGSFFLNSLSSSGLHLFNVAICWYFSD